MIDKEAAELRRRLHPERHSIKEIFGCYVSEIGEVIATFSQSPAMMPEEECERFFTLFRRALSGSMKKNLVELSFSTAQVADSDEHRLLMGLRDSACESEELRQKIYNKIIASQPLEGNYVILLLHNTYDVPFKGKDGKMQEDFSDTSFSYIQCCVCPVKLTKSALQYKTDESEFHNSIPGWTVAPPELGFLFPAFDDRSTNIYEALFYTHDTAAEHESFIREIFNLSPPMPAALQKNAFQTILADTLEEECSLDVLQKVHNDLTQMIQVHKESRTPEPLTVNGREVRSILESAGISEAHAAAFNVQFDSEFGTDADLSPKNIIEPKKFELALPQVSIKVAPEYADLIETRIMGGVKYLVIKADETVEVNGVPIHIE